MRWRNGATSFRLSSESFTLSDESLTKAIQQLNLPFNDEPVRQRFCNDLITLTIWRDLHLQELSYTKQVERNKETRSYYYVFIVNELYKTVTKTEDVTPGRIVIITSRDNIAKQCYKRSCNQHSIHRAIQHSTISSWKSQSDLYVSATCFSQEGIPTPSRAMQLSSRE